MLWKEMSYVKWLHTWDVCVSHIILLYWKAIDELKIASSLVMIQYTAHLLSIDIYK